MANIKYKGLRDLVIDQQNQFRELNEEVDEEEEEGKNDDVMVCLWNNYLFYV